jgi:TatD DNase family protein
MTAVREAGSAGVRGVLHCYTGSHELAEVALSVGWYVSFSGIVTFGKWKDDALIRLVPDDRILVETDAPYLAPVPKRGRRNEPAFARYTVERLAVVRNTSSETLGAAVTANARRLLNLPVLSPKEPPA